MPTIKATVLVACFVLPTLKTALAKKFAFHTVFIRSENTVWTGLMPPKHLKQSTQIVMPVMQGEEASQWFD
jgi:hypothetical protein